MKHPDGTLQRKALCKRSGGEKPVVPGLEAGIHLDRMQRPSQKARPAPEAKKEDAGLRGELGTTILSVGPFSL